MEGQSHQQPTIGTPRSNREFAEQLTAWDFAQRKVDGVHRVFRGPHGGTLRVIRSLAGRTDIPVVEKPPGWLVSPSTSSGLGLPALCQSPSRLGTVSAMSSADAARPRPTTDRDRVTSLVLGVHAQADRPLGFDQVVDLAGARVTRDQVRTASAQLCREGDLDRIRPGVYQWSDGVRSHKRSTTAAAPVQGKAPRASVAELFDQLFPSGVRMTADLLADFERWAELTEKLAEHARAS